jgi:hypothetical protein
MKLRMHSSVLAITAVAVLASSCGAPELEIGGAKIMNTEEFVVQTENRWRDNTPEDANVRHPEARCYFATRKGTKEVIHMYCGPIQHYPEGGWAGGTGAWDTYKVGDGYPVEGGANLDSDSLDSDSIGFSLPPDVVLVRPDGRKPPRDAEAWSKDRRR